MFVFQIIQKYPSNSELNEVIVQSYTVDRQSIEDKCDLLLSQEDQLRKQESVDNEGQSFSQIMSQLTSTHLLLQNLCPNLSLMNKYCINRILKDSCELSTS